MSNKLFWGGVALLCLAALVYGVYWCCISKKQVVDAVINVYIKIFCER